MASNRIILSSAILRRFAVFELHNDGWYRVHHSDELRVLYTLNMAMRIGECFFRDSLVESSIKHDNILSFNSGNILKDSSIQLSVQGLCNGAN